MCFFFCSIGQIIKREQSRKWCQLLWFCFYFSSLCDWSKIIRTILSTNQVQNPTVNQSKPDHPRFPRLKKFFLFSLWIIFGSQIGELTIRSGRLKGYKTASSVLLVKKIVKSHMHFIDVLSRSNRNQFAFVRLLSGKKWLRMEKYFAKSFSWNVNYGELS